MTPLLTPDPGVYANAVKALIAPAAKTLRMQFQYIELPKTTDASSQAFVDLVEAVIDRQEAGVDVRIIMSEYETAGYLEQLQAAGLDVVTTVKIQNNVHNKASSSTARASSCPARTGPPMARSTTATPASSSTTRLLPSTTSRPSCTIGTTSPNRKPCPTRNRATLAFYGE